MPNNHAIGSDRRKVSHKEYVEHLFKVAAKMVADGKKEQAKAVYDRAALTLRQPEKECEVCFPNQAGVC